MKPVNRSRFRWYRAVFPLAIGWLACSSHPVCAAAPPLHLHVSAGLDPVSTLVDADFDPAPDDSVYAMAMEEDGSLVLGGSFQSIGGYARERLARLRRDGTIDPAFDPRANGTVGALAVQADGGILVAGVFTSLVGHACTNLGRLFPDGTFDASFQAVVEPEVVHALGILPDGRILIGGNSPLPGSGFDSNPTLRRLEPDGTTDPTFEVVASWSAWFYTVVPEPDGTILTAGQLSMINGQTVLAVVRLLPDGNVDPTFNSTVFGTVHCLARQPDGRILVGGALQTVDGEVRGDLARLNPDGSLDAGFAPAVQGEVRSIVLEAGGGIILGGNLEQVGGVSRSGIARLHPDGTLDAEFDHPVSGQVYTLTLQPDGDLLVGGHFDEVEGNPRSNLARVYNTGILAQSLAYEGFAISWLRDGISPELHRVDFGWSMNGMNWTSLGEGLRIPGGWSLPEVSVPEGALVQARGRVIGGRHASSWGWIDAYWGAPTLLAEPQNQTKDFGSEVVFESRAIGSEPLGYQWYRDGVPVENDDLVSGAQTPKLVLRQLSKAISGEYTVTVTNPIGVTTSETASLTVVEPLLVEVPQDQTVTAGQHVVLSVLAQGTEPLTYQWQKDGVELPGATDAMLDLGQVASADAGDYRVTVSNGHGSVTSEPAALTINTGPEIVLQPVGQSAGVGTQVSITVEALGEQPLSYQWQRDGNPLSDGDNVDGSTTSTLTLSNLDEADGGPYTVVVGNSSGSVTSEAAWLSVNTALPDPGFAGEALGDVLAAVIQPDGRIIVGGRFTRLAGQTQKYLGRLNPDGSLDPTFNPEPNTTVRAIVIQPDGTLFIGGDFTRLGGLSCGRLGRILPDGSVDSNFKVQVNDTVHTLARQVDGKILVGGEFTSLGSRAHLARLNADGSLDSNFLPYMDGDVHAIAVQPDDMILLGGGFDRAVSYNRPRLARIFPNVPLDETFQPEVDLGESSVIHVLVVEPDGQILVGGSFETLGGESRHGLGRLNPDGSLDGDFIADTDGEVFTLALQANGDILLGGNFTQVNGRPRAGIARVDATGTLDPHFSPVVSGDVSCLVIQPDGGILVGGGFQGTGSDALSWFARLLPSGPVTDALLREGSVLRWERAGVGPEVWRTVFEHSDDGLIWNLLGRGTRVGGGWELAGAEVPAGGTVRARGWVTGGLYAASAWATEAYAGIPIILTQPVGSTNDFGSPVSFHVLAKGDGQLTYQWRRNGVVLVDDDRISGSQTADLQILNVAGADAGEYTVTVSNASGSVTSEAVVLAAVDPLITGQPLSQTLGIGQNGALAATVAGSEPLSYEWWHGEAVVPGATAATLQLTALEEADAGDYHVVVSNPYGTAVSASATLTLVEAPVIIVQPDHLHADPGEGVAFNVQAVGVEPLEYQWWKDGAELPGADGPMLELPDAQTSDLGWYQVVVRNGFGEATSDLVSLSVNGADWDLAFAPELAFTTFPRSTVLAIQPDDSILLGGGFPAVDPETTQVLYRFRSDGTRDTAFLPDAGASPTCLAIQPDGGIVVGGNFNTLAGMPRQGLGRLLRDGSLDHGFDPQLERAFVGIPSPRANALVLQPDAKIVIGGEFEMVGGEPRRNLARLNADGTLDAGFFADASHQVSALALQPDGRIVVGGSFTQLAGESRAYMGRLDPDGSLDQDFNPTPNQAVTALAVQPDGRILVSGNFSSLAGQPRSRIARLNADGTPDVSFGASMIMSVSYFGLQTDGRIVVVQRARTLNDVPFDFIGRLNPNGSLDLTFHPESTWSQSAAAIQSDGAILVGAFGVASWDPYVPPSGFGRLNNTVPATQSLEYDGSTITWLRGGTSPEVWRVTFEHSPDETDWTMLAEPSRVAGGWELTDVVLPAGGSLRARGYVTGGQYNCSSWFVETRLLLSPAPPPQILLGEGSPRFTQAGFELDVVGTPDATVVIEVSLDLLEWVELETVILEAEPTAINDPDAGLSDQRFYRVRQLP